MLVYKIRNLKFDIFKLENLNQSTIQYFHNDKN